MTIEIFFGLLFICIGSAGMYFGQAWMVTFILAGIAGLIHDWRLGRRVYRVDDRYYIVTDAKLNSEED